jgi:hypothetical protein
MQCAGPVTGYAATTPAKVSGAVLAEPLSIAEARARVAADWMTMPGVPAERLSVSWKGEAEPADIPGADGLSEPSRRRVDIRVIPASAVVTVSSGPPPRAKRPGDVPMGLKEELEH